MTSTKSYLAVLAAAVLAAVLLAAPAHASEAIESFSVTSTDTSAGGHPDFTTSFTLANPGNPEAARNVTFNAPKGLFGNPNAVTRCTAADFGLDACPSDTQVGLVTVSDGSELLGTAPIFDLVPGVNQTALFAFIVPKLGIPINIPVAVRTSTDYGLRFTVSEITQQTPLASSTLTFWGFPAAPEHDSQRFPKGSPGQTRRLPRKVNTSCLGASKVKSSLPEVPLTDNPTICTGQPLTATLTVQTYQDPAHPISDESDYPATTECEKEVFKPVLYASPTTQHSDSPSGLNVELSSPQFLTHAASPSEIRSAIVTLPEGLTVNPDAADGQSSCTDAEMGFGSEAPSGCPDQSKIGTFALHTVALSGPLIGAAYIGRPQSGNQYRLFMAADGFGVHAKLEAKVVPDPVTGRLQVFFTDLPQAPFDDLQLHLFASDRGLMATPTRCAVYGASAQFFPWNDVLADQTSEQFFSIRSGPGETSCPGLHRPFNPRLLAGTSVATAGAFSDFHLRLDRDDGDQFLGDLGFTMPPGFVANLRGIPYCPEAAIVAATQRPGLDEQAAPSCPVASQIGTTNVAAGPGTHPFHAIGRVYLAGPLQGAPLSLAAITPALAGPYDYGTIVVRVALHVDPQTAQVTALSEPVPRIVGGVPIRMRSIQVNIERSDANGPTSRSTRRTARRSRSPPRAPATKERWPASPPTSTRSTATRCPSSRPWRCASSAAARAPSAGPTRPSPSTSPPGPATPTSNRSPSPSPPPLRSTPTTSATSAARKNWSPHSAPAARRSAKPRRPHRCSTSPSPGRYMRSPASGGCPGSPSCSTARSISSPGPKASPSRTAACGPPSPSSPTPRSATSTSRFSEAATATSPTPATSAPTPR